MPFVRKEEHAAASFFKLTLKQWQQRQASKSTV